MKSVISLLLSSAAALYHKASEPIPDSYIVKFHEDVTPSLIAQHELLFAQNNNVNVEWRYSFGQFFGYAATITDKTLLAKIEQQPEVEWVEENGMVYVAHQEPNAPCNTQAGSTWGITRTANLKPGGSGIYRYPDGADGAGVEVGVIDTGLRITHNEFEGRAVDGFNAIDKNKPPADGNGHGTHCGGTIGGKTYGMAKKVTLVAIKVLSDAGSGSNAQVIAGVDYLANRAKTSGKRTVGSMSLGGGTAASLDAAVNSAVTSGVIMVVAAGNDNKDACSTSPARAAQAITVCATDQNDRRASFSNYGTCTHIFAPGVSITSAWYTSNTATNTISGTSMACPHVAGQVAKYLKYKNTATAAQVKQWLGSVALTGIVTNPGTGSTNKLLFADCATFGSLNETIQLEKRY